MKTLDQILETGTPSEREVVKLAHQYPLQNPSHLIKNHGVLNLLKTTGYGALAVSGGVGIYYVGSVMTESTESCFTASPLLAVAAYLAYHGIRNCSSSVKEIVNVVRAAWYEKNPDRMEGISDGDAIHAFYHHGAFTLNPSPAQAIIGKPVYPVGRVDELKEIKGNAYALVGAVYVDDIVFEESSMTESNGEAVWTTHYKQVILTLRRDGEEPSHLKFSSERKNFPRLFDQIKKDEYISLLFKTSGGSIDTIERIYPVFDERTVLAWRPTAAPAVPATLTQASVS